MPPPDTCFRCNLHHRGTNCCDHMQCILVDSIDNDESFEPAASHIRSRARGCSDHRLHSSSSCSWYVAEQVICCRTVPFFNCVVTNSYGLFTALPMISRFAVRAPKIRIEPFASRVEIRATVDSTAVALQEGEKRLPSWRCFRRTSDVL